MPWARLCQIDTELVYAYAKTGDMGALEEFMAGGHAANLQARARLETPDHGMKSLISHMLTTCCKQYRHTVDPPLACPLLAPAPTSH